MAVVETLEIRFRADLGRLNQQLTGLAEKLNGLDNVTRRSVARIWELAGGSLASSLASGIRSSRSVVAGAARQLCSAASFEDAAAAGAARSAGADLARGFAGGITDKIGSVKSSIQSLASSAVSALKKLLKIASPSKLTRQIGAYFGEGFAGGIQESVDGVARSAAMLGQGAAGMLARQAVHLDGMETGGMQGMVRAAVNEALGDVNLVVPLNVDGMKLGEASIRGINRVTRAAGRVMLEF